VLFSGVAEVVAFACFVVGADHAGVAVVAVLSSQFAVVSAVIGYVALGERLARAQLVGIVAILAGVAVVTGLTS
jgi:drug/metabolite transporter (DMT)-like permease